MMMIHVLLWAREIAVCVRVGVYVCMCVRRHLQSALPLYQSKVSSVVEKLGGSIELRAQQDKMLYVYKNHVKTIKWSFPTNPGVM